jgi:hypothetical protein
MPSEHERPNMFAPGHRLSDIGPPGESPSQGEASQQHRSVRHPHYERWYRERHRQRAYEALTQNQIRQSVPTSAQPTTSANPHLLQQAQSSSKARRSSQVINGVLYAGSIASPFTKSPPQNELTEDDGETPKKSGPQLSIVPPTPPGGKAAPTSVLPRQNIQSLTVPDPFMPQPRKPQPEANTQPFTQLEKERHPPSLTPGVEVRDVPVNHRDTRPPQQGQRHPPSLTPGVAPSQVEVRDVPVNHRDTRPPQQGQRHDAHRPLPALPVEPAIRNVPVNHRDTGPPQQDRRHPPSLTPGVAPSQVEVQDVPVNHRDTRPPQQGQRHDAHRPLPALPVEPTVRIVSVVHQGARPPPRGQRYYVQHPPPVEPAVASRPPIVARPTLGSMSRLGKFLWYRGGRSGGVQPVTRDGSRPVVAFGNLTAGSDVRPPGKSTPPVEGLFELGAGVDAMAELESAVVAPPKRDYVGDYFSVRHEGPPVLPPLLVDDGLVGLDFAPPAAETETSAPIYELFTRERDWDFDMEVAEQYKKVCGTNHSS